MDLTQLDSAGVFYIFVCCSLGLLSVAFITLLVWSLFSQRTYKEIDGKLYIREGLFGKWEDAEEHLKREHPEEYAKLKEREEKK